MALCSRCTYPSITFSSQDHGRLSFEHIVCCVLCGCMRALLCDELCVVLFGVLLGGVVCCGCMRALLRDELCVVLFGVLLSSVV